MTNQFCLVPLQIHVYSHSPHLCLPPSPATSGPTPSTRASRPPRPSSDGSGRPSPRCPQRTRRCCCRWVRRMRLQPPPSPHDQAVSPIQWDTVSPCLPPDPSIKLCRHSSLPPCSSQLAPARCPSKGSARSRALEARRNSRSTRCGRAGGRAGFAPRR
jgi:hypothetical protein